MPGYALVDLAVEPLEEGDGREVLVAAEPVGLPLARPCAEVEPDHRLDAVDPQAVDVVLVEPEQGVGDQEVDDLGALVVERVRVPERDLPLAGVGVLVEVGAVELGEAVRVGGEVGGDPVEDHPDAPAVQGVDQEHEVLRACRTGPSAA